MFFVWFPEQIAIIFTNGINQLVFKVRFEVLNII
jgi:hypothetical protein